MSVILEVCVDDAAGIVAAVDGGADRIELCAALPLGGLTPSPGLMAVAAQCGVPVMAMIRHRAGDFILSDADIDIALRDIAAVRAAGLSGVVIGASRADGTLDEVVLGRLVEEARGLDVTLHRAFDLVPDVAEAVACLRRLGIQRVLTSGGATKVVRGLDRLAQTMASAGSDITVMPGSGVSPDVLPELMALGPIREIHASCSSAVRQGGRVVEMGFVGGTAPETSAQKVRSLKAALMAYA